MGFFRRRTERRAVEVSPPGGYSDQLIAVQSAYLTGEAGRASALAAAEAAAGLIGRAVSSAKVSAGRYASLITPRLLSGIVRGLIYQGEQAVWLRPTTAASRLSLVLVAHTWLTEDLLQVEELLPNGARFHKVGPEEVALPMWAVDPFRPWKGISPLANLSSELGAAATSLLVREARSKHGYLLYSTLSPSFGVKESPENVRETTRQVEGKFGGIAGDDYRAGQVHGHSQAVGYLGRSANQLGVQTRFGFDPPAEALKAAEFACLETLKACGVPPILYSDHTSADRQAHRNFLTQTAEPLAEGIAAELSRVLEAPVILDLSVSRTGDDLASRGRAVKNLTEAGLPLAAALEAAGIPSGGSGFPAPSERRAGISASSPPGGASDPPPPQTAAAASKGKAR